MRRVALAVISTVTGLVFLLSFKSHSTTTTRPAAIGAANNGTTGGSSGGSAGGPGPAGPRAPATSPSSSAAAPAGSGGTRTVTGDTVQTMWGPVQVQVTISGHRITKVAAVNYPNGNPRDGEINAYAIPTLNQEVMSAQSGKIDAISGATITSDGYIGSLQNALDKAGF